MDITGKSEPQEFRIYQSPQSGIFFDGERFYGVVDGVKVSLEEFLANVESMKLQVGERDGALKAIAAGEGGHNHEDARNFWPDCASCWVYRFAENRKQLLAPDGSAKPEDLMSGFRALQHPMTIGPGVLENRKGENGPHP